MGRPIARTRCAPGATGAPARCERSLVCNAPRASDISDLN
jgi:hypothetical protein